MNVLTFCAKMGSSSTVMSFKFSLYHPFSPVCHLVVAHSKVESILLLLLYKTLVILNSYNHSDIINKEKTLDLLHSRIWRLTAFKAEWRTVFFLFLFFFSFLFEDNGVERDVMRTQKYYFLNRQDTAKHLSSWILTLWQGVSCDWELLYQKAPPQVTRTSACSLHQLFLVLGNICSHLWVADSGISQMEIQLWRYYTEGDFEGSRESRKVTESFLNPIPPTVMEMLHTCSTDINTASIQAALEMRVHHS